MQRRVETVAALWECFEHYPDFKNGWNSVKVHADDGFLTERVMTSFCKKMFYFSLSDQSAELGLCAGHQMWVSCPSGLQDAAFLQHSDF